MKAIRIMMVWMLVGAALAVSLGGCATTEAVKNDGESKSGISDAARKRAEASRRRAQSQRRASANWRSGM